MTKILNLVMLVLLLSVANAWGVGFFDDFDRPDGDVGNGWTTQSDGTITVKIVNNEVLVSGTQGTDWRRCGISRPIVGETKVSCDFKAGENFNFHIRINGAGTSAFLEIYTWGGPLIHANSVDGSWPGWTDITGSNIIADQYNNVMLEQNGTEFAVTLNGVVVATLENANLTSIASVLIASDSATGTTGSLHIDNVSIGDVSPEKARDPIPEDGAFHEDTWITLSWTPGKFAVSHDVYLGEDFDVVSEATRDSEFYRGNQGADYYIAGFPGFAYPEGLVPGTTYYWRIDEVNDADPNSPWKGDVWSFSVPPKTAYNPNPADGTGLTDTAVTLRWTPGFGAKLHTVYFGDNYDQVNTATIGVPRGTTTYSPGPLEREKVYYWRVDEFDGLATYKGDVWAFTTPGAVGNPQPDNGAIDVGMAPTLTWTAATNAASHQVYFGLDKDAVRTANTGSPEYKGPKALGAESYDPGLLELGNTYYWRVDEVYNGNPVKGPVWNFTVGNYLLVEDFESYTDDDAAGQAIWQTWIDGFGVPDNGAQVGYLLPPYAEQMIVHGGDQSMPLIYTNEAGVSNSEAAMTLTAQRDWTIAGVEQLSIWYRGSSANAAEPLYVALSNTTGAARVVANDDLTAANSTDWEQWRISLQAFADQGVNLADVDKIAVGLGSKSGLTAVGGTGTMYIDDIRLY
ncbi:MAG: hypothetical protein A2Z25_22315 [Planctomycetes bacterium RBG_16_55_9]|nr:MAG: hypothetical protein A2Z25_22315 [Planctomycetes bacterium RBG_16_55_9]